jgi:hypothetical protein
MMLRLLAATALVCALPASAGAAPARNGNLSAASPNYAWDGAVASGIAATADIHDALPCQAPVETCDETLIKIDEPGNLAVKIVGQGPGAVDLDLYVYVSDESGKPGKFMKSSTGATAEEQTTAEIEEAGYYLVQVTYATAFQAGYKGTSTFEALPAATPPAPAGGTGGTPANVAPKTAISAPKGKVSRSKLKGFRGTASDDSAISKVQIGLVQVRGDTCKALTAKGTFAKLAKCTAPPLLAAKGTKSWTFKLRKPLPKGTYVLYARATDDKGLAEGGYGPQNKVSFTVR